MTTADDLLAAIIVYSEDVTARLVYADFLEEGGDPRAEFIRVQCRIAAPWSEKTGECWQCHCVRTGQQHTNGPCRCSPEFKTIRRREAELLDHLGSNPFAWFNGGVSTVGLTEPINPADRNFPPHGRLRRGFVEEVWLPLAVWCGDDCPECHGDLIGLSHRETWPCETCFDRTLKKAVGRVNAHGPAIVRATPITRVVTERRPDRRGRRSGVVEWTWFCSEFDAVGNHTLPPFLWQHLEGGRPSNPRHRHYPTEKAALDAASEAYIAWARSAAGLPALTAAALASR